MGGGNRAGIPDVYHDDDAQRKRFVVIAYAVNVGLTEQFEDPIARTLTDRWSVREHVNSLHHHLYRSYPEVLRGHYVLPTGSTTA